MSIYLGPDSTGEEILHLTNTAAESLANMKSPSPITTTTYHSKGNYLDVHRHDAVKTAQYSTYCVFKFPLYGLYDLWYNNGTEWRNKIFIIVLDGQVVSWSLPHYWSLNGTDWSYPNASASGGYNYDHPYTWFSGTHSTAYMLVFNVDFYSNGVIPTAAAKKIYITPTYGIYFDSSRPGLGQTSHVTNVINSVDPTFYDHSGTQLQVVNSFNYYDDYPQYSNMKISAEVNGGKIDYAGRAVITGTANMWCVPTGSITTTTIPKDSCSWWGTFWDCRSPWTLHTSIYEERTIANLGTTYDHYLVTLNFGWLNYRTGNSWTLYSGKQRYSYLVTRGGSAQVMLYAGLSPLIGPGSSMTLYLKLTTDGRLYFYHSAVGGAVGGFSVIFYNNDGLPEFHCIPVG